MDDGVSPCVGAVRHFRHATVAHRIGMCIQRRPAWLKASGVRGRDERMAKTPIAEVR
jgi:hypothetical protein